MFWPTVFVRDNTDEMPIVMAWQDINYGLRRPSRVIVTVGKKETLAPKNSYYCVPDHAKSKCCLFYNNNNNSEEEIQLTSQGKSMLYDKIQNSVTVRRHGIYAPRASEFFELVRPCLRDPQQDLQGVHKGGLSLINGALGGVVGAVFGAFIGACCAGPVGALVGLIVGAGIGLTGLGRIWTAIKSTAQNIIKRGEKSHKSLPEAEEMREMTSSSKPQIPTVTPAPVSRSVDSDFRVMVFHPLKQPDDSPAEAHSSPPSLVR